MKKVKKAGCILINIPNKTVYLVYREKLNDFSFPKGHLEKNETLIECAIRETKEETKRDCVLLSNEPIYVDKDITNEGIKELQNVIAQAIQNLYDDIKANYDEYSKM